MIKKVKKGFTIVELVIVIAVIGVLAAVLIPTFISLNKKADEKADNALVHNLNTALRVEEAQEGKNPTLHDVAIDLEDYGYKLANLVAKSEQKLLWDELEDKFVLDNGSYTGVRYWEIRSSLPGSGNTHSIYAGTGWNTSLPVSDINYGFDAGDNAISSIGYKNTGNAQTVTIRTNGGTLTIDAEKDTVKHYGEGEVLDIKAIAGASYHEYGNFPKASIAQGRIVVEEEGNIPAFEITAVPTSAKPIEIETNKSIVVAASQEVVEALGSDSLENVDIKVTNAQAEVVVDEKIDTANVEAAGKTAEDLVSIKKVSTHAEIVAALAAKEEYIMFANDIQTNGSDLINVKYSATIDGDGHKLTGNGGLRGTVKQMLCFGYNALELVDKITVKNLTVQTTTVTRPLECRGNTKEIVFDNVVLDGTGPGNDQGFTFGGTYSGLMKLTVRNCNFSVGGDGYTFLFFNAVDMLIEDSVIAGWAGLYFKSPSSSHGARDSKVLVKNSDFICHNQNWGATNAFGAIVFEDGNIDVTLVDSNLDVTSESDQEQCAILFSSGWASYYGTYLKNGHVVIKGESSVNGYIDSALVSYDLSNDISIEGGIFTSDPTPYVAAGHTVSRSGALYIVK